MVGILKKRGESVGESTAPSRRDERAAGATAAPSVRITWPQNIQSLVLGFVCNATGRDLCWRNETDPFIHASILNYVPLDSPVHSGHVQTLWTPDESLNGDLPIEGVRIDVQIPGPNFVSIGVNR